MPDILQTPKQKLIDQILVTLGNEVIDLDDHLNTKTILTAIDFALEIYRQKGGNSQEESIAFLRLEHDKQDYFLPEQVMEVREIFKRSISPSTIGGDGNQFDPFSIAYTNLYLLQAGGAGGLFTFELYNEFLNTAGLLFGAKLNFTWDHRTKRLRIVRSQRDVGEGINQHHHSGTPEQFREHHHYHEEVLLWIYNSVPDDSLIKDTYCGPWIRRYATAQTKMMLGQAYEKFSTIVGPQSPITLNGATLKAEAQAEMDKLELELQRYGDGSNPLSFIIG